MHGHRLVVGAGVHELQAAGEADLHAHQAGQHQGDQADEDRGQRILDGNDLVVLAPDVAGQETLRLVQDIGFCMLDMGHRTTSVMSESLWVYGACSWFVASGFALDLMKAISAASSWSLGVKAGITGANPWTSLAAGARTDSSR
ncbi:hypothetical protein D9M71_70180 [compost metagenome]